MGDGIEKLIGRPDLSDMPSPVLRDLLSYWIDNKNGNDIPATTAIDPLLIPTICLPYVSVLSVEQNPIQYYIRLTGTAICDAFGYDPTGRYIHEIGDAPHPDPRLTWCLENRAHYIVKDDFAWRGDKYKHYHALALPFADTDNNLSRIVIAFWFT